MDALGCRRPDVMTRVSEYMMEIVEYIQTIMDNNMAYEGNGSVHFDTQAFRYIQVPAESFYPSRPHAYVKWLTLDVSLLDALNVTSWIAFFAVHGILPSSTCCLVSFCSKQHIGTKLVHHVSSRIV